MPDTAQFRKSSAPLDGATRPERGLIVVADNDLTGRSERGLLGLSAATVLTSLVLSASQPQHLWAWLLAGLFLPVAALWLRSSKALALAPSNLRVSLNQTLIGVGVLILLPLLMRLGEGLGVVDVTSVRRVVGVLLGAALMVLGSYLPGWLFPLLRQHLDSLRLARQHDARQHVDAASVDRLLRFVGAGLMFAGALYGLAWMFAPLAVANLWASASFGAVALFVGCRFGLLVNQRHR